MDPQVSVSDQRQQALKKKQQKQSTQKSEIKHNKQDQPQIQIKQVKQDKQDDLQKKFYEKLNAVFDEYFLSQFQKVAMTTFIQNHLGNKDSTAVDRIRPWLLAKINGQRIKSQLQWQKGCPDIIPTLRAKPWWNQEQFPWLKHFEENYKVIRDEILELRSQKGFQPYRGPSWISDIKAKDGVGNQSVDSGTWNIFYLELHNMKFDVNCEKVPKTMQLLNKYIPNNYHHSFISALTSKSHIMKHYGPTNKKLRFHLPLMGVKGSRLRVADQTKQQEEGKAYVFDDSFEHQAWHDGDQTRLILIADFWHPDLTTTQLKFLKLLQNSKFRAEQKYSQMNPDKDNFYSIIENAKDIIQDNEWWVIKE